MTFEELKEPVEQLSPGERFKLAAYLQHLADKDDVDHLRSLDEACDRVEAGDKIPLQELRQLQPNV